METKEIKGLPTLGEDASVKIWKMNFGFRNDMTGDSLTIEVDSQGKNKAVVHPAKAKLGWLIYGIYEAPALNIPPIKDIQGGFSDAEKTLRIRAIRNADQELVEAIYKEIYTLNNPKDEEDTDKVKND